MLFLQTSAHSMIGPSFQAQFRKQRSTSANRVAAALFLLPIAKRRGSFPAAFYICNSLSNQPSISFCSSTQSAASRRDFITGTPASSSVSRL